MLRTQKDRVKAGPMNVALYVRVSTDKQASKEDGSLDTQLDKLMDHVAYRCKQGQSWVVTEKLIEGERGGVRRGKSGKDTNRPALQRLRDLAKARAIDVVVVTKIDRISRSVVDFLLLVKEIDDLGVKLVSLHESIDMTTPSGKFQTTLLIALAEHERETISARTKEKVGWRAEKGLPIGPPPIGYVMKDKMYVIDEPFAKHVRAADALYLEKESSHAVLREFSRLGYRTPRGRHYTVPLLARMLRKPTYAGKIAYEGKVYDAQWKPIRTLEIHERIQHLMDGNARRNGSAMREKEYPYLLQGLLRCAACDHMMCPTPGIGRNGRYYPYYSCTVAQKSLGQACARNHLAAEAVDRAVIEYLKKLQLQPEMVGKFVEQANALVSDTAGKLHEDLQRIQERLAEVRSQLAKMVDAIAQDGKAAMATVGERMQALEVEREELEKSEARLRAEIEAETCQVISAQDQVRTLGFFKELVEMCEGKPDRIKFMLRSFVDNVIWRRDKNGGTLEIDLFPVPFVRPGEATLKKMLSEVAGKCGSGTLLFRPGVADGVPDGT